MAIVACPNCKHEISDKVHSCPYCGKFIGGGMAARGGTSDADDPTMRMLLPVGRSGWAIASGYLGLISVLMVPAPLALITGIVAVRDIRKDSKKHGMGRAVFGIIMGGLGSIALVFFLSTWLFEQTGRRR